jgi:1-hydroxycarotenoid 3,4-desaturase
VSEFDVVVIGAGLGGLAAAIELGAQGRRVVVLEAQRELGGKAGRTWIEGVEVDTGPSLLTMPEVFDALLRRAGTSLADEVELLAPDPWFRYLWPDGARLDVAHRLDETLAEVGRVFGARAEGELADYLAHAASIWEAAAPTFVLGAAPTLGRVARMGPRALPLLLRIEPLRSLRASIRARVREPHVAMLLERYATYNGSDPGRAPATLGCIAHVELARGGHGIRGGVSALVRALGRAAERVGVELRTGARVARIARSRGQVAGVELAEGGMIAARTVIANADPAHVHGALLEGGARTGALASEPSMSAWTAIVKARRVGPAERAAHTVLFPHDYPAEFRDVFERERPPEEPTVYLCAQERAHGRAGWDAHEPIFAMVNAPPEPAQGASADATWSALRERAWRRLEGAGLVAAGDAIAWERTPRELAATFPGSRGALYGTSSNSIAAAFLRPANTVRDVPGLYLASGGAHPGGGMPLAALSGRQAALAATR